MALSWRHGAQRARAAKEERRRLEREAQTREKEERARLRRQEAARGELVLVRLDLGRRLVRLESRSPRSSACA